MSGHSSQELVVTKTFCAKFGHAPYKHLIPVVILSMVFCLTLGREASACSASSGQTGEASWYGPGLQGNRTASGETFDMWAMTAAHPCLPMGTRILVTVLATGRSLMVTVNDRLPSRRRILDLSVGAARALGIASRGVAAVQLSLLSPSVLAAR
jgi:rare lipoprotein A